jgi:ADP-heptose:LPS heptosyltransferase
MQNPRRILTVRLASLGDVLIVTPALRALRSTFPDARIGMLTTPVGATALRGNDSVDDVIVFDKFAFDRPRDALHNVPDAIQLAQRLRAAGWDTLLLLHHLTTSFGIAKYAALALGSGAERRVGLDNGRGRWFLTESAPDAGFGVKHEVDYWLDVARVVGAHYAGEAHVELPIAAEDEAWAASVAIPGAAVMLVPGSGAFSRARRWAPERFAEVARTLSSQGLAPVVLGGLDPDERALARHISELSGAQVIAPAPSPQTLAALIRRCRLVVANDGGVVHIATTVNTPVVAIFGPSNDRAWGPYPPDVERNQVVREQLACAPCIHRGHRFGTPQGCPARTCLAILEVPRVLGAVQRALGAAPRLQAIPA